MQFTDWDIQELKELVNQSAAVSFGQTSATTPRDGQENVCHVNRQKSSVTQFLQLGNLLFHRRGLNTSMSTWSPFLHQTAIGTF